MRGLIWLIGVGLALSACGGESDEPEAAPNSAPAAPTSSAAAEVALIDACPQVEEVELKGQSPGIDDLNALLARVTTLANSGNTETELALKPLREAAIELSDTALAQENQNAAWRKFDNAMLRLAQRCQAVGSSAFTG